MWIPPHFPILIRDPMGMRRGSRDDDLLHPGWILGFPIAALLYLALGFLTLSELEYTFWGRPAVATILNVNDPGAGYNAVPPPLFRSRSGRETDYARYSFLDANGVRRFGAAEFPLARNISEGETVEVLYLDGTPPATVVVQLRQTWSVPVFLTMTVLMAFAAAAFILRVAVVHRATGRRRVSALRKQR